MNSIGSLILVSVLMASTGCRTDDSTEPVPELDIVAACRTSCPPPPPKRCQVDASGNETGRCVLDDAANGVCALGITGVQGCVVGRHGTTQTSACGSFDDNSCTATGWLL
jgi:hypothetical protein